MLVSLFLKEYNENGELIGLPIIMCVDFESYIEKIDFLYPFEYKDKKYLWCQIKGYKQDFLALSEELEEAFKKQKGEL